ncbi:hypothetical protein [Luteibacter sp.]|uniref:hypothetical protein n=1 Tax=Luteibacter sp. TaxID=1886636 RepID=UPI003F7D43A7
MADKSRKEKLRDFISQVVGAEIKDDTLLADVGFHYETCLGELDNLERTLQIRCPDMDIDADTTTFAKFAEYVDKKPSEYVV